MAVRQGNFIAVVQFDEQQRHHMIQVIDNRRNIITLRLTCLSNEVEKEDKIFAIVKVFECGRDLDTLIRKVIIKNFASAHNESVRI
jgi:hypothetical protein